MKFLVLPIWLKDQLKYSNKVKKLKFLSFKIVPISRLPVLATPSGSKPNKGTCTESNYVNVSSDVNPTTNIEEMDFDDQEDLSF